MRDVDTAWEGLVADVCKASTYDWLRPVITEHRAAIEAEARADCETRLAALREAAQSVIREADRDTDAFNALRALAADPDEETT